MGKEIEIKLAAPDAAALEAVGADARVEAARTGAWQEIRMVTEYLDTPDRAIAARKWTLRRRTENGEAVYTIKTPGDGYARGEWESRKESLHEAVRELVRLGAPGELAELAARGVSRTCGVEFLRRTAELTLDGTRCALCLDDGMRRGGGRSARWSWSWCLARPRRCWPSRRICRSTMRCARNGKASSFVRRNWWIRLVFSGIS